MADFLLLLYSTPTFDRTNFEELQFEWSVRAKSIHEDAVTGIFLARAFDAYPKTG